MKSNKLLYEAIRDEIIAQIADGTLPIDTILPTIQELQKQHEVSHITILRVLHELRDSGLIEHCGRRYRVCRQFSENGSLKADDAELPVGIFLRPMRAYSYNNYFNDINLAIESELCLAHKYYVRSYAASIFNYKVLFSDEDCRNMLRDMLALDGRCCGMLIDERIPDKVLAEFLRQRHRPVVLVNRFSQLPINAVGISVMDSAHLLWRKAQQLGYTDIVMASLFDVLAVNDKAFGTAAYELDKAGEFPQIKLHLVEHYNDEGYFMREMVKKYEELATKGKILFHFRNNESSYLFIKIMREHNHLYGRDYGVCGFYMSSENDGYPEALTTVKIDTDFIGRTAARQLLQLCAHPWQEQIERITCPQEFIFGETM